MGCVPYTRGRDGPRLTAVNAGLSRTAEVPTVALRFFNLHPDLLPMNRSSLVPCVLLALLPLPFVGCGKESAAAKSTPSFQSLDQKASYGIGFNMARNLDHEKIIQLDRPAFMAGIEDGLAGAKTRIPEADLKAAFIALQQKVTDNLAAEGGKQLAAGNTFLAQNKARAGVKTTVTGLQYEVLVQGMGRKPKATDTVRVHYHGTLLDGTVFDSSVQRGQPIEFAVGGVIPGWTEALQMMTVGSKWKLFIPSALAYGPSGRGKIPPNATLTFEVELLGIK